MRLICIVAALASATAAGAQVRPQGGPDSPHLQSVDFHDGEVVELFGAPGFEMTLELSPDEHVQNVAIGDSNAWSVNVSHSGDRLFLKPTQPDVATNMTVITSVRVYNFDLHSLSQPASDMPYTVSFNYPDEPQVKSGNAYVDISAALRSVSRYKVSGDKWLRPDKISNDGKHTYISWSEAKPIPAVFAVDEAGRESVANGQMRDDVYVVDSVPGQLTFRIDRRVAHAVRLNPRKRR
jgi:type IV secretion system protein VirB9